MSRLHVACLHAIGLLAAFASRTPAQDAPPPGRPLVTGQVGLVVISAPRYQGADERWLLPLPFVNLRVADRLVLGASGSGLGAGAAVVLVESRHVTWTADLSVFSDRPEDRAEALRGLGNRGVGLYVGTALTLRQGIASLTVTGGHGVEQRMGLIGTAAVAVSPSVGRWFSSAGVQAVVADRDGMRWDFAVTPQQAAASAHPAFDPAGGLRELNATLTVGHALSRRWSVFASGQAIRLQGDAARSPLVQQRTNWVASSGILWNF